MCDVLLPPSVNPTAVKHIYHIKGDRYVGLTNLPPSCAGLSCDTNSPFAAPEYLTAMMLKPEHGRMLHCVLRNVDNEITNPHDVTCFGS
jgi:hypothetical protein